MNRLTSRIWPRAAPLCVALALSGAGCDDDESSSGQQDEPTISESEKDAGTTNRPDPSETKEPQAKTSYGDVSGSVGHTRHARRSLRAAY
jgi:hypothetical protein